MAGNPTEKNSNNKFQITNKSQAPMTETSSGKLPEWLIRERNEFSPISYMINIKVSLFEICNFSFSFEHITSVVHFVLSR